MRFQKGMLLEHRAAVPSDEELGGIGETNHGAGGEQNLTDILQVLLGHHLFQAVPLAAGHDQRDDHRKTTEHGPRDEVGGEDSRVPARELAHGEVETNNRVHAEHQRRGQRGQQHVRFLIHPPLRC